MPTETVRVVHWFISSVLAITIALSGCTQPDSSPVVKRLIIPSVAEVTARSIAPTDLVALRDIGGYFGSINISPGGELVAFQLQQGDAVTGKYITGWFAASTAADAENAISLGDGGEVLLTGEEVGHPSGGRAEMKAQWSPDSEWIVYRVKNDEQIQLWRSKRDGSVQEQLTHNDANVSDFRWSADGDKLFFEVGWSRSGKQRALQREGEVGYLFDDRFPSATTSAPDFSDAAYDGALDHGHVSGVWTVDFRTAEERAATEDEEAAYEALTAAATLPHRENDVAVRQITSLDGSGVATWLERVSPGPYVLRMIKRDGGEIRCEAAECSGWLRQLMWSSNGEEIYFVRLEGEKYFKSALYAWSPTKNVVRSILTTEDWITSCDRAADLLVCLHETATTPRKIVTIDPSDGSMRTVVDPNPEFQDFEFTQVETLEWKEAHSGATAGGHLVYPIGYEQENRYPMVIVQYASRGFLRGGVGNEYPIHPLAANGFFVLSFERPEAIRSTTASGDRWDSEKADWGEDLWERSATLSALEVIVEQLDERGLIDPDRVGITGLSDGAETVWYAMMHSTHFAAAAASSGGWSPSWYYQASQTTREGYYKRAAELLPPGTGGHERWKRISPEFHADAIDVPIMVQVSDSELVSSAPSIGSLMDAGKPIETYVFPDEYHLKWQPKHKLSVYERNIDWFNFWLRGVEDSDSQKISQYERWRKLREQHIANLKTAGKKHTLPVPSVE